MLYTLKTPVPCQLPLLQEWRRQSALQQLPVDTPALGQVAGAQLEPRPSPDGRDKSSGKRTRSVRRCLPTLEGTRATMDNTHIYLPPLTESQLASTAEQGQSRSGDSEELDVSVLVGGARMPLTHAASNLSIYSTDGDAEKGTPHMGFTNS